MSAHVTPSRPVAKEVTLTIPGSVYERISSLATLSGQTVTELLIEQAVALGAATISERQILALHAAESLTVPEIGARLDITNARVQRVLARYHRKPHPVPRGQTR